MRLFVVALLFVMGISAQTPPIEPGVPLELAKWRAARYSDVRYKLNLTLEKMSPVLKGTMEMRVNVSGGTDVSSSPASDKSPCTSFNLTSPPPIILDWRTIRGHEEKSAVTNISINGWPANLSPSFTNICRYEEYNEHLIFRDGVVAGENVITLDFTSPILTSGSAITRYIDKEDGSEYIYSLFVPSDASTAFPVFDQPDLKARFRLSVTSLGFGTVVSNSRNQTIASRGLNIFSFGETKPISTYVFAFAAGPFHVITDQNDPLFPKAAKSSQAENANEDVDLRVKVFNPNEKAATRIFVRKSQSAKFKPHAAEVFRLNREAIKYFEEYFDYKFPFPKYDLVLIPEFPFGGMEHAGATFLRESAIIFPQEPTKYDHISRALLIFHEASHQWFGDTVTMRWFDDLWLKEGFATFTAYKAMERIMPEMMAWKVFYERVKQAAYQTDSTKGTTPIYQEIPNLSAAKSAYGNIVYNKAPAFLRQAEFYLGEDKFQTAVRAFLKKHEFGNAGWEDLVKEFELASKQDLTEWANVWVKRRGSPTYLIDWGEDMGARYEHKMEQINAHESGAWKQRLNLLVFKNEKATIIKVNFDQVYENRSIARMDFAPYRHLFEYPYPELIFPNHSDFGYGIFLLDRKSREYVLKNIQNEKDPFLRSMMWGALWDSVREGELDPREYVELVTRVLMPKPARERGRNTQRPDIALASTRASAIEDESTTALLLSRVGTAMSYYVSEPLPKPAREQGRNTQRPDTALAHARASATDDLRSRVEEMLIDRMRTAPTLGQRITFYRAFLNVASSERSRLILKQMLTAETQRRKDDLPLKAKDKFDIVTRLLILGDADGPKLLAELEKTETSDDAKRYAYAARAGIATAENKAKYWNDFVNNKDISESWIEAAFGPWNSIRHSELTLPYLERALKELPNHKRSRKIFFVNGWLGAFIGGQRSEEALGIINKFLADNPALDRDLRLKILENADIIERAVNIRKKFNR